MRSYPDSLVDEFIEENLALKAALKGVLDWYERDGSVGGCSAMIEEHVEPWVRPANLRTPE